MVELQQFLLVQIICPRNVVEVGCEVFQHFNEYLVRHLEVQIDEAHLSPALIKELVVF